MLELIQFFRVVPPVPRLMTATFVAVTSLSVIFVAIDARYTAGTIDALLVLQLFAVSSGFGGYARRGYYDLLLTRGARRIHVALMHWLMSSVPGVASWITLASAEAIAARGTDIIGFSSGTATALVVTSMIGWAITVPLPRFAGAIGWVVVFAMAVAIKPSMHVPAALANMVYPLAMVGGSVTSDPLSVLPVVIAALVAVVCALAWVEQSDAPLEAAQ